jgi:aminoglycoside phosphotransferase (APT) family kinase protein
VTMAEGEVRELFRAHGIEVSGIRCLVGSFQKDIVFVNDAFVVRQSKTEMGEEQERLRRIEHLPFVPRIVFCDSAGSQDKTFYEVLDMLPGIDFIDAVSGMTTQQQALLGQAVAAFLDELHSISGPTYDIGHYIPIVAHFSGSWREGHHEYWKYLEQGIDQVEVGGDGRRVIDESFQRLRSLGDALVAQSGPSLLHNDFHPKNILVDNGALSGVIDWECSQFGEPDFELCHLIHWCDYPPRAGLDFRPFLGSLLAASPTCTRVPRLSDRLTIYEIEHEIFQMILSGGASEAERLPRLVRWLEGGVPELLSSCGAGLP